MKFLIAFLITVSPIASVMASDYSSPDKRAQLYEEFIEIGTLKKSKYLKSEKNPSESDDQKWTVHGWKDKDDQD